MKHCIVILACSVWTTCHAQSKYFTRDTLASRTDSLGQIEYSIGEKWFLTQKSNSPDTLNFTREFFREKSSWKLEFDHTGHCYLEGGMMSCNKWGIDFLVPYEMFGDVIIMDKDSTLFELFDAQFDIQEYSESVMTWVKK